MKLKVDTNGEKEERKSEERANLALTEGMEILMEGITEGQDRRFRHVSLGVFFFLFACLLLWVDPFGPKWYIVSRIIITISMPFATAELILGFIAVSDEILALRQVALEMDLTRQMDPHWRVSSQEGE